MARSASTIQARGVAILPPTFNYLEPLVAGQAAALALSEANNEAMAQSAVPSNAEGMWLTLVARGEGLERLGGETDARLLARIRSTPNTTLRAAVVATATAALDGVTTDLHIDESAEVRIFCDPGATEYVLDAYCDEDTILSDEPRAIWLCIDNGLSDVVINSLVASVRDVRAAGVLVYVLEETGIDPIDATFPWETP